MDKKIVFFDIDGTLSDEETFEIPDSTREALTLAGKNGHILMVNTGRPYAAVEAQIRALPLDGLICGCGTNIFYHGEEIYHHKMAANLRRKIVQLSIDARLDNVLEGRDCIYFPHTIREKRAPYLLRFRARYQEQGIPTAEYRREDDVPFDKMALWYYPDSDIRLFQETFRQDLEMIRRGDDFLENMPIGCSKASGIERLLEYLKMDREATISIGDSTNDLPMLRYTRESVAMGNSHPDILGQVTYVTSGLHQDGIYHALAHFGLI